ncbi:hypothetical protein [Marinibacterium sp. SX1]|uniref:hypothetical protein n=1 Tax=Marinibacterium sp. SX1 TaxID=3388424 RepID=UPI003D185E89
MTGTEGNPFGFSIALRDGDIVMDGDALRLSDGLDNLAQSLTLHLATPFATDLFNPRYGLDLTSVWHRADRPVNTLTITKAEIHLKIVEALSRDPRVREVREVAFDDSPRFLELAQAGDPVATPPARGDAVARRRWRAVVVVDVGIDDTVALLTEGERLGT